MSEDKIRRKAEIEWGNFTEARSAQASSNEKKIFLELFRMALKFQDRETRHACADAVAEAGLKEMPEVCKTATAYHACINTQNINP